MSYMILICRLDITYLHKGNVQSPRFVSELQEKGDGLILSEKKTRAENKGHLGTLITIFGLILASVAFFMSLVDIKRGDRSNPMRGGGIVLTIGLALISTPTIIKMYTAGEYEDFVRSQEGWLIGGFQRLFASTRFRAMLTVSPRNLFRTKRSYRRISYISSKRWAGHR